MGSVTSEFSEKNSETEYLYTGKDINHVEDTHEINYDTILLGMDNLEMSLAAKYKLRKFGKHVKVKRKAGRMVRMAKRPPKVTRYPAQIAKRPISVGMAKRLTRMTNVRAADLFRIGKRTQLFRIAKRPHLFRIAKNSGLVRMDKRPGSVKLVNIEDEIAKRPNKFTETKRIQIVRMM